jgi:hypothetical protein
MPTPVVGARDSLIEYLRYQHSAFLAVSLGLTDEQGSQHADGQRAEHWWAD